MAVERILVTGGAGFIGSALSRALVEGGQEVTVLDDLSVGRREFLPAGSRLVQEDIRDSAAVEGLLEELRPERVFHLAALHYIPHCDARPVDTLHINVGGTRVLLEACRRHPPLSLFVASTAAVYPPEGSPFGETTPTGPIDMYGHSKLMAEDLARLFHRETGVRTVIGRLFNAFGPNDPNPHLIPAILDQVRGGKQTLELGNLDPVRDYVHVDDVVTGILAASRGATGTLALYNIGSGRGYSVRDVVAAIEQAVGHPLEIVQTAHRVRKVERQHLVADIGKLSRDADWQPRVTFAAGMAVLIADGPTRLPEPG